jgi:hypothetical protein
MAQKLAQSVNQAYLEMGLDLNDDLSFFYLVELLTKLGYVDSLDDHEKQLLASIWTNLETTT